MRSICQVFVVSGLHGLDGVTKSTARQIDFLNDHSRCHLIDQRSSFQERWAPGVTHRS